MIPQTLPSELVRVVLHHFEDLNTPLSLSAAILLRHGEWEGLARLRVDPRDYVSVSRYVADVAAVSLLKKLNQLPGNIDRKTAAIEKWWHGEHQCLKTNHRLYPYLPGTLRLNADCDPSDKAINGIMSLARKYLHSWLGSSPPDLLAGKFGPGSTYSDRGGLTTIPHKLSSVPSYTADAIWYLPQLLSTKWGACLSQHQTLGSSVRGNRFTTVPKTALTDRAIASEPSVNIFFQLALGGSIRQRLKAAGLDIRTAQDLHKRVACEASVTREFATLDLSNASDTLSTALVRLLVPPRWWEALNDLRSKRTFIGGKWVLLEKFSSMGNGFTFELETAIFAALTCAVTEMKQNYPATLGWDVFVYGDDIICKDDVVESLAAVLRFSGFSLNSEKSYYGGTPFRESCGGDYMGGLDVRPFFLKELPDGPTSYIALANSLRALSLRLHRCGVDSGRRAWFSVLDNLPTFVRRCRGPKDLGDLVVHDEEAFWTVRWRSSIRYIRVYRVHKAPFIPWSRFSPDVVLACATYGVQGGRRGVTPRSANLTFKVGWKPYS